MSAQNRNESFRVLEELVTELGAGPNAPPVAAGRSRGADVTMTEELIHDAGATPAGALESELKSAAARVAALLATAPDPTAAAGAFQKLLLAELAGRQSGDSR